MSCNKHGSKYYWNEQQHVVSDARKHIPWQYSLFGDWKFWEKNPKKSTGCHIFFLIILLNTNNTDHHSITQILLTVVLNTNNTDHHSITQLLLTVVLNTNNTDHHSITELLLTVVLNTNKTDHHSITQLLFSSVKEQ